MRDSTQALMNYTEKNHMVLKLYWICTACVICMQIIYFVYFIITGFPEKDVDRTDYIRDFILIPAGLLVALGLVLTVLCYNFFKNKPTVMTSIIMAGLILFVNIIACIHYGIAVIFVIYIFPVLLSLFFNNRKMTLLTSFFVFVTYVFVAVVYLPTRNQEFIRHKDIDMAAMPVVIILATVVGMRILDIYSELIDKIIDQTIKKITLERKAKEDSLTKLYNHAVFYDSLDFAVSSFDNMTTPFCIAVMDLDNFKAINDTYGHSFGDLVLLRFADVVRSKLDESDMAFRYGGEEFSIITFRALDETVSLAEDIRTSFEKERFDGYTGPPFTVSIGVCEYSEKYNSKREFFASADRALYAAKRRGKNQTAVADDNMERSMA